MSTVCAIFLAGVFALAALAKLRDRAGTRDGFVDLGLPLADFLAWAVPLLEVVVAALLILAPGWGGVAAFALLLAFTVVLITTISSGRLVACRCFGGTTDEPVSWGQVVRNVWLLSLAVLASLASSLHRPTITQLVVSLAMIGVGPIAIGLAGRRLRVQV